MQHGSYVYVANLTFTRHGSSVQVFHFSIMQHESYVRVPHFVIISQELRELAVSHLSCNGARLFRGTTPPVHTAWIMDTKWAGWPFPGAHAGAKHTCPLSDRKLSEANHFTTPTSLVVCHNAQIFPPEKDLDLRRSPANEYPAAPNGRVPCTLGNENH